MNHTNINPHEIRRKYLDFFASKGHAVIPSASLIPENDPTVLFNTAGMQPLVPYLMGAPHPQGRRLVDAQKCVRTGDIDEVGDNRHLTFFEMLGNWSLGDYFKAESIAWSFEFLTGAAWLALDPRRIHVTVFEGDADAPRDDEAERLWRAQFAAVGVEAELGGRIRAYGKEHNWWSPGPVGPCGADTEIFFDTLNLADPEEHAPTFAVNSNVCMPEEDFLGEASRMEAAEGCHPQCDCGRYVEIWNNVFMEHYRDEAGRLSPLDNKNVDTGMGLERLAMTLQGAPTVFETGLFAPLIDFLKERSGNKYYADLGAVEPGAAPAATGYVCGDIDLAVGGERMPMRQDLVNRHMRIVADHLKAATMIIGDDRGVSPSNVDQGYIVRRLIRRAMRSGRRLCIDGKFVADVAERVIAMYQDAYPELVRNRARVIAAMSAEEDKFARTLEKGLVEAAKLRGKLVGAAEIPGADAFYLYESFGFPKELTEEVLCLPVSAAEFDDLYRRHQEKSRAGSEQKFAGGLADHSEMSTRYHTATHLLHAALRRVLGDHVEQRGSNITPERMRFDFNHADKLADAQKAEVERIVNEQIARALPVTCRTMTVAEAKSAGAIGLFEDKYSSLGERVKVYSVGDDERGFFSREICGGPHVGNTSELGRFAIKKEESSGAGIRRIKAVLE
jgi:alanyl-tRNA synthetase